MSNEIQPYHPQSGGLEPRTVDELMTIGRLMHESGFFGDTKNAAQAAVKILAGRELGVGPFSAMSGIHVFQGKAEPSAHLRLALIQRNGGDIRPLELTETLCEAEVVKGGEVVGKVRYTIEEANRAGVMRNPVWKAHPTDMLWATVVRKAARRWFSGLFFSDIERDEPETVDAHVVTQIDAPALESARRRKEIAAIATCRDKLGWDDDLRHRFIASEFDGRMSLKDLDDEELDRFLGLVDEMAGEPASGDVDTDYERAISDPQPQEVPDALTPVATGQDPAPVIPAQEQAPSSGGALGSEPSGVKVIRGIRVARAPGAPIEAAIAGSELLPTQAAAIHRHKATLGLSEDDLSALVHARWGVLAVQELTKPAAADVVQVLTQAIKDQKKSAGASA